MRLGVVLLIVVGALLMYSGIHGRKFTESLSDLFSGKLSPTGTPSPKVSRGTILPANRTTGTGVVSV